MNSDTISLKPGYQIYSVSVDFAKQVHMIPGGFTTYNIDYAVALSPDLAETLIAQKYATKGLDIRKVMARPALEQDIRRYCFSDHFAGFGKGCVHPEYPVSQYSKDDAKALVNEIDQFVHKGIRKYVGVRGLASQLSSVWSSFGYWSKSSCELQESAISALDSIADGSHTNSAAEEILFSVMGMFNQSLSSVVNFSGSVRH